MSNSREWIKEGEKYVFPEKKVKWKMKANMLLLDKNNYIVVQDAAKIMKLLKETDLSVLEIMDETDFDKHTLSTWSLVQMLVANFSFKGVEFVRNSGAFKVLDDEKLDEIEYLTYPVEFHL